MTCFGFDCIRTQAWQGLITGQGNQINLSDFWQIPQDGIMHNIVLPTKIFRIAIAFCYLRISRDVSDLLRLWVQQQTSQTLNFFICTVIAPSYPYFLFMFKYNIKLFHSFDLGNIKDQIIWEFSLTVSDHSQMVFSYWSERSRFWQSSNCLWVNWSHI